MPFTQTVTPEDEYILITGDGSILSAEELLAWSVSTVREAQDHAHTRLLVDNRTLTVELTPHEVMVASDQLFEMEIQAKGLRFAVVSCEKTRDMSRFIETTFTNRSASYKRFDSLEDALNWLLA